MDIIKKNTSLLTFALLLSASMAAQQLPQFTQYMYNTVAINPAYAGSREALSIVALHRSQWNGFNGGPKTLTVSANSPLRNDKIGVGMSFIRDELGYERFSYLYGDFSYTIRTGENTELAFGLKAGFTHYELDNDLLSDPSIINDPYFNNISNHWSPNMGLGIYWHSNKWYMGLSSPRIFTTDYNKEEEFEASERIGYYLTGGYVFTLSKDIKFKPAFLIKATNGSSMAYDFTGNFLFYEKMWIGAAYRVDDAAAVLIDFQVTPQWRIGYTYEQPISDIRPYTSGTHEILLMFELKFNNAKYKSPRYF
ncbi:PorP/SprF family type IX secretion system membrane protein [Galbibacter pacificus]|uniref:Type IX secretion system membrane protein PorP/SprF n=1 Tax=Galbibacter pacificus TaxID=2996052 RepID=A0ABT6FUQ9_9FLAO|nr:type IX secretion system membrane protein PorP/SprF [Galbibacter pacificus]MDG3583532.1 type IX secretion system membrane protein PorP/SprF [Galbibacter pacificus]MDG3586992.1 type IX secretion system membrane protein PorP/SprF [Galbibacter pacificus]